MGLSRPCLPIREDSAIVAIEHRVYYTRSNCVIYELLLHIGTENGVEREIFDALAIFKG